MIRWYGAAEIAAFRWTRTCSAMARHDRQIRQSVLYAEMPVRPAPPPFRPVMEAIVWMESSRRPGPRERRSWRIPASRRWILWAIALAAVIAAVVL